MDAVDDEREEAQQKGVFRREEGEEGWKIEHPIIACSALASLLSIAISSSISKPGSTPIVMDLTVTMLLLLLQLCQLLSDELSTTTCTILRSSPSCPSCLDDAAPAPAQRQGVPVRQAIP